MSHHYIPIRQLNFFKKEKEQQHHNRENPDKLGVALKVRQQVSSKQIEHSRTPYHILCRQHLKSNQRTRAASVTPSFCSPRSSTQNTLGGTDSWEQSWRNGAADKALPLFLNKPICQRPISA